MENKFKSADAERFVIASQLLIDKGLARSFKDIADRSGYSSQDYTDIKSGKKDLQRRFLDEVVKNFPINEEYVLTGKEPMLKTEAQSEPINQSSEIEFLKMKVELYERMLKMKDEVIDELREWKKELIKKYGEKDN